MSKKEEEDVAGGKCTWQGRWEVCPDSSLTRMWWRACKSAKSVSGITISERCTSLCPRVDDCWWWIWAIHQSQFKEQKYLQLYCNDIHKVHVLLALCQGEDNAFFISPGEWGTECMGRSLLKQKETRELGWVYLPNLFLQKKKCIFLHFFCWLLKSCPADYHPRGSSVCWSAFSRENGRSHQKVYRNQFLWPWALATAKAALATGLAAVAATLVPAVNQIILVYHIYLNLRQPWI